MENFKDKMLAEDGGERVQNSGIEPYVDPALRSRRAMTKLACRLWLAGMLGWVSEVLGEVSPFTVVKSVGVSGEAAASDRPAREEITAQRMVLDQRRENRR